MVFSTDGVSKELWHAKNPGGAIEAARKNLLLHLAGLDARRPLDSITDPAARDRARILHRICAAWDYGVQPSAHTFALLSGWKDIFDRFPVVTSPAYHAMRLWFGWEAVPIPSGLHAPVARYIDYDRLEGRGVDPCEHWI
jgi:hypothetical protein